jgi:hypothetical protein
MAHRFWRLAMFEMVVMRPAGDPARRLVPDPPKTLASFISPRYAPHAAGVGGQDLTDKTQNQNRNRHVDPV